MIYNNKKHNFELFLNKWPPNKEYILYGASKDASQLIKTIDHLLPNIEFKISLIVDDDKNSKILYDYPIGSINKNYNYDKSNFKITKLKRNKIKKKIEIINFEEAVKKEIFKTNQIIITSDQNYQFYKKKLENLKMIEDIHFCNYKKIAAIWPFKIASKIHLWRTDILLTEKCSLNCTFCNMYMPHYNKQKHRSFEELENDLNSYFTKIDYVSIFHLVGGEPLLSPYVSKIIDLINHKYRKKIGYLFLTTNGTVKPKGDVLEALKKTQIDIHISDYTDSINYGRKFDSIRKNFEENKINFLVRKYENWSDFGHPSEEKFVGEKESIDHFDSCSAPFRGLNNSKYYYCHLNTSAVLAKKFKDNKNDYYDLNNKLFNGEELLKLDLGFPKKGYVTFCKNCYGCNTGLGDKVNPSSQGLRLQN